MPTDDPRIEQALHAAAPSVDRADVLARVTDRRVRRRRNRRLTAVASTLAVLLVVGAVTALLTRDDGSSPHIATPGSQLRSRVVTGGGSVDGDAGQLVEPRRVTLDEDAHLLRAPLLAGATALSVASYDPGEDGSVLSHVVRIDGSHVIDIKDFKAHILSIAEGEGARWALTQNPRVSPGGKVPDTFLKRIPASGDPTSVQLPLNSDPVGPIAAVGGAVWVPVRDGVLQLDPAGAFVRRIPLADAPRRSVAMVGKGAVVTDGNALELIDPVTGSLTNSLSQASPIVDVDGRTQWMLVTRHGSIELAGAATPPRLPRGFTPTAFSSSPACTAVVGTVDGAPAIVLLGDDGVLATVVLENATNGAALAWTGPHTVSAVSGDALYDIEVP